MDSIRLKARAKINLGLDVIGKRDNGYHDVRMIMQSVGIYDRLIFTKTKEDDIVIHSNLGFLPVNENNLIYKAIRIMQEQYGLTGGIDVDLNKFIPVAAGLAGGSSDAATTLFAMNRLYDLGLSLQKLMEIGVNIGADVPFCIMRGTVLAEGIGEKLTRLPGIPRTWILIAKPQISVSTRVVYEKLDMDSDISHPNIDALMNYIYRQDIKGIAANLGNVLETVTIPLYPVIADIKQDMLEHGALNAMMSGSGPTVFGIFAEEKEALSCQTYLKNKGYARQVYITETFN